MSGPLSDPGREIDAELRHHIDECVDLLISQGWRPGEARREAERRFGDAERVRQELRRVERRGAWIRALRERVDALGANVRYALRSLRLNPGFAAAVVVTLGLGAGVATSMFAVLDAVALRPLAYADADRWVEVRTRRPNRSSASQTVTRYEGWREAGVDFADAWVGYFRFSLVRTDGVAGELVDAVAVTPRAPTLLGVPLLMGRSFTPEDGEPGAPRVGILARHYYERLGADPHILGRTLQLDTGPITVVGVLRGGVKVPDYGSPADLWLPIRDDFTVGDRRIEMLQGAWARLRPGIDLARAQERADAIATALQEEQPLDEGWRLDLLPLGSMRENADQARALWMLTGMVGFLLVIALVNGVNLLLVRSTGRTREFAVRAAMGASRAQLMGQLLVEGLVLGLLGGGLAVLFGFVAVETVAGIMPGRMAFFSPFPVSVEARTLCFSFGLALLAGTVFGLVPAVEMARTGALPSRDHGATDRLGSRRVRRVLVAGQVALATVLLFAAGLFLRSIHSLLQVDPGFDYRHTAVVTMELPSRQFPAEQHLDVVERVLRSVEAQPGISAATFTTGIMFATGTALEAEGGRVVSQQPSLFPHSQVRPGYLEVVGARLLAGRAFRSADRSQDVAIVDQDLARLLWGSENAVGRRFRLGPDDPWLEVVGVVQELRLMGRDQRSGPYQMLRPLSETGSLSGTNRIFARTPGDPAAVLPELRRAIGSAVSDAPIHELQTGAQLLAAEESQPRFLLTVMATLGAVAVLLASVGLYGTLSYSVRRRTRELGVRMALGASGRTLLRMVLSEGMVVALVGMGVGLLAAYMAAGAVGPLLYRIEPRDPWTFVATGALFLIVALVASVLPALRATSVDPARSLRVE